VITPITDPPVFEQAVAYHSEGVRCAATLYLPTEAATALPGVVLGHGLASVRTMSLPAWGRAFAAAGIAALAIDYRFLGESDGEPRQQVDPYAQREDFRNALSFLAAHPAIDAKRLGLWGTSFAGGHVLHVAAFDRRVKAVVAQVPALGVWRYLRAGLSSHQRESLLADLVADRRARTPGAAPERIPITAPDGQRSVLGSTDLAWHRHMEAEHPTFHNEITLPSLAAVIEYDPAPYIESIAPTPLLMIVAERDRTTPPEVAYEAFARAGEQETLLRLDATHYDLYDDPNIRRSAIDAARDFFRVQL
jgi:fermentation-respiration switch protein FrsA (DUF1100 family)